MEQLKLSFLIYFIHLQELPSTYATRYGRNCLQNYRCKNNRFSPGKDWMLTLNYICLLMVLHLFVLSRSLHLILQLSICQNQFSTIQVFLYFLISEARKLKNEQVIDFNRDRLDGTCNISCRKWAVISKFNSVKPFVTLCITSDSVILSLSNTRIFNQQNLG